MIIRLNGTSDFACAPPYISLDAPDDFEGFKNAVMAQKDKLDQGFLADDPPQDVMAAVLAIVQESNPMNAMIGMMGGMMGGGVVANGNLQAMMMMQQQQAAMQGGAGMQPGMQGMMGQMQAGNMGGMGGVVLPPPVPAFGIGGGGPGAMGMDREIPVAMATATGAQMGGGGGGESAFDISRVLDEMGLQQYSGRFLKEGIDGNIMRQLDDASLQELGVDSGLGRAKILGWINRHR